jgi:fructose-bisphosphate aldolase class II
MYDGSSLPFSENVKNTRNVVELAHMVGVSVEGELGYLNNENGEPSYGMNISKGYTTPESAAEFVKSTGVDALAIAIGNAHGLYKGVPILDFVRLSEISSLVSIPLVLHGCSGIPEDSIKKAVSLGVGKINVNTEVSIAAVESIREVLSYSSDKGLRFEQVLKKPRERMVETISRYISLLNNK